MSDGDDGPLRQLLCSANGRGSEFDEKTGFVRVSRAMLDVFSRVEEARRIFEETAYLAENVKTRHQLQHMPPDKIAALDLKKLVIAK